MKVFHIKQITLVSFLFILCLVFPRISITCSEDVLEPHVSFSIHFQQPDFENYTVQTRIQSSVSAITINQTGISVFISNGYTSDGVSFGWNVGNAIFIRQKDNWTRDGDKYFNYNSEHTVDFSFFGASELYPFDSYFLNLTFSFKDYGDIKNFTKVAVIPRMLFEHQTGWKIEDSLDDLTITRSQEDSNSIYINKPIILKRMEWSTQPLLTVLLFGFLVLGAVLMIKPDDLRSKSALYTAIFVFFGTFYFNFSVNVPKRYSLSVGENMILILISGAALFLVFSIIQYKVSQYSKSTFILKLFNHLLMSLPLLTVILTINQLFESARSYAKYYFWINIPKENIFILFLITFWIINILEFIILFFHQRIQKDKIDEPEYVV